MELTVIGRLVGWLAISLLVVGFFFSNSLILMSTGVLVVYLISNGLAFRRAVETLKHSVMISTHPTAVVTTTRRPASLETTINNDSGSEFRIVRVSHNVPLGILRETAVSTVTIRSHQQLQLTTTVEGEIPGRFVTTESTITFEKGIGLFRQSLNFADDVSVTVWPRSTQMKHSQIGPGPDPTVLYDLAADRIRRGIGTDFAGLRPWNTADDLRAINWKATARTGKLMATEFYLQKDPTIMLLIDTSSSMRIGHGECFLSILVDLVANFLTTPRIASSSIGLALYDTNSIADWVDPQPGQENRTEILRRLLQRATFTSPRPIVRVESVHSHRSTHTLITSTDLAFRTDPNRTRFKRFVDHIFPFYEKTASSHLSKLRRQGAFKAFEMLCDLGQPTLVIAITDGNTNLDGLYEGAKYAAMLNHRVIVATLFEREDMISMESTKRLDQTGKMLTIKCTPDKLWAEINSGILDLSRKRPTPEKVTVQ